MFAAHYKLDNLCAIVDNNGLQIDGTVEEVMSPISHRLINLPPLAGTSSPSTATTSTRSRHAMNAARKAVKGQAHRSRCKEREGQGRFLHGESGFLARRGSQRRSSTRRPWRMLNAALASSWQRWTADGCGKEGYPMSDG